VRSTDREDGSVKGVYDLLNKKPGDQVRGSVQGMRESHKRIFNHETSAFVGDSGVTGKDTKMRKAKRICCHHKRFVVDGKVLWVYAASRIPMSVRNMTILRGIDLQDSKKEERAKYVRIEKEARRKRNG